MDPAGRDDLAFWLAHLHPAVMLVALALAGLALRQGLAMRRRRIRGEPPKRSLLAAHLKLAKPAVLLVVLGLLSGPVSAVWLRGWSPFGTLHGWLAVAAAGLFVAAAVQGHRLEEGRVRREDGANGHGLLGTVAMLLAAVAAAAGMVLLP
jgi:uncharacterized membrane protein YedE/YeeE